MGRATAVCAGAATAQRVARRRYIFGAFFAGLTSLARLGGGPATYKIAPELTEAQKTLEEAPGACQGFGAAAIAEAKSRHGARAAQACRHYRAGNRRTN